MPEFPAADGSHRVTGITVGLIEDHECAFAPDEDLVLETGRECHYAFMRMFQENICHEADVFIPAAGPSVTATMRSPGMR